MTLAITRSRAATALVVVGLGSGVAAAAPPASHHAAATDDAVAPRHGHRPPGAHRTPALFDPKSTVASCSGRCTVSGRRDAAADTALREPSGHARLRPAAVRGLLVPLARLAPSGS